MFLGTRLRVAIGWLGSILLLLLGAAPAMAQFTWTTQPPLPVATSRGGTAAVSGKVYILGGATASGAVSSVYAYDPMVNAWQGMPPLPEPRFAAGEAVNGGTIYLAGGGNPADTATVIAYDTVSGTSYLAGSLTTARFRTAAAFINNRLYVVGGSNSSGVLDTIEAFDPATGASVVAATLPAPRELAAVAAVNGKIYIIGGTDSAGAPTGNTWEYDPVANSIVPKTPVPVPCAGRAMAADNGKIYLMGGVTSSGFPPSAWSSDVLEYDPVADTWQNVGSLLTSRAIPMVAVVNNTLYTIGGSLGGPPFMNNLDVVESAPLAATGPAGWVTKAPLLYGLSRASSGVVNDRLFIIGGAGTSGPSSTTANVQVYDPATDSWQNWPPFCTPLFGAGSATVGDTIYVAGGFDPAFSMQSSIYAYNTMTGACWQAGTLTTSRARFSMTVVDNTLYSVGGSGDSGTPMLDTIEAFDLATNSSSVVMTLPEPRVLAGVTAIGPRIYILGGSTTSGVTAGCWVYDPIPNMLFPISPLPVATEIDEAVVINGKIYVVNTFSQPNGFNLVQEYDPATDTWRIAEQVPTPRNVATIAALQGSLYVIGGDSILGGRLNEAWQVGSSTPPPTDTTPPHTVVGIAGSYGRNGWYVGPVTFTLTATDNPGGSGVAGSEYSYDTVTWYPYYGPVTVSTEGTTSFYYRSRDRAGNLEPLGGTAVSIDRTSPLTSAQVAGSQGLNGWYSSTVTLTLNASDNLSGVVRTEYSFNGIDWLSYAAPLSISADGTTRVSYRSVDNAGNTEWSQSLTIAIDRTTPSTAASLAGTAGTNGWLVSPATVTITAVDSGSGIALTEYSLDNGASWSSYSTPVTIATEGTTTLLYRATDNAGLASTAKALAVKIDTSAPRLLPLVERASVSSAGAQANGNSNAPLITPDGRFIAFWSTAATLVGDDTNASVDVFVHDRVTGTTDRASISTTGEQAIYPLNTPHFTDSFLSGLSADGRYVIFTANASNLAPPLGYIGQKVYLRDRQTGTTEMVSVSQTGTADTADSYGGAISADGRYVAFSSQSMTLVPGLTTYQPRVFVKDRQTGAVENISVTPDGADAAGNTMLSAGTAISSDGRYVLFLSSAANLVADDTNGSQDLFIRDRQLGQTRRVNVSSSGAQSAASTISAFAMSADGRYVAFESSAKNLVTGVTLNNYSNTYLHDMQTGTTVLVNVSASGAVNRGWQHAFKAISPDGRYVAFLSDTVDIIPENPYLFNAMVVHDMQTGANELLCSDGCSAAALATGNLVTAFASTRSDLVTGDTNGFADIFVRDTTPVFLSGTKGGNGWYTSVVTATLGNATDAVSGLARREYSLDGTSWTTADAPFAVDTEGAVNLLTRAVDNAGLTGANATTVIKVDRTPPVTSTTLSGTSDDNGWYRSDVSVTLTAQDATSGVAATEYSLNGTDWLAYVGPFTITAEGTTTLSVRSRDIAGNVEQARSSDVKIDRTAPATSASLAGTTGANSWYTSAVTVTLAAVDTGAGISATEYRLDATGTWITYTGPITVSTNGTTTLSFRSRDHAGMVEAEQSVGIAIDTTLPAVSAPVSCTQLNTYGWCNSAATFTMNASDPVSGIAIREYRIGAGAWTPYTAPVTIAAEGITYVAFRAVDVAGQPFTLSTQVGIDTTPPVTTAALTGTAGTGGWYTSAVSVTLGAADALSGITLTEYRIGTAGAWTRYAGTISVTAAGSTTIFFHSKDGAGNLEADKSVTVTIDTTAPTTTATLAGTAGDNGWYRSAVTVTLGAADAGSGVATTYYRLDGGAQTTYTGAIAITTTGSHAVEYWSEDRAGNAESHKSVAVNIDLTAPTVVSSVPVAKATKVPVTQTITLTMSEAIASGTAYNAIALTYKKGSSTVSVVLTKGISGTVLSLKPSANLPRNTLITLTVPAGAVKDLAGNPTTTAYTLTFTTQK